MGKTPAAKRLTIQVPTEWIDRPEIKELEEKGHWIIPMQQADLMIGPACHYFIPEMFDENLLETALKAARARKGKR